MTLSPRIACLQAMLPAQLKPSTNHSVGLKLRRAVQVIADGKAQTVKQQECLDYLIEHPDALIQDIPYTKGLLDQLLYFILCYLLRLFSLLSIILSMSSSAW